MDAGGGGEGEDPKKARKGGEKSKKINEVILSVKHDSERDGNTVELQ